VDMADMIELQEKYEALKHKVDVLEHQNADLIYKQNQDKWGFPLFVRNIHDHYYFHQMK
jgi:hypothetical protein